MSLSQQYLPCQMAYDLLSPSFDPTQSECIIGTPYLILCKILLILLWPNELVSLCPSPMCLLYTELSLWNLKINSQQSTCLSLINLRYGMPLHVAKETLVHDCQQLLKSLSITLLNAHFERILLREPVEQVYYRLIKFPFEFDKILMFHGQNCNFLWHPKVWNSAFFQN